MLGLNSHPMPSGPASLWFLCTRQANCYVFFFFSVTGEEYELFRIIRVLMFVPMGLLLVAIVTGYARHFVLKTWLHQTLQWVLSSIIAMLSFLAGRHFSRVRIWKRNTRAHTRPCRHKQFWNGKVCLTKDWSH